MFMDVTVRFVAHFLSVNCPGKFSGLPRESELVAKSSQKFLAVERAKPLSRNCSDARACYNVSAEIKSEEQKRKRGKAVGVYRKNEGRWQEKAEFKEKAKTLRGRGKKEEGAGEEER